MIAGAFIGALAAELYWGEKKMGQGIGALVAELYWGEKKMGQGLKAAAGSFLGFLLGTGAKLAASGVMLYYIVIALIP